ncbi:MULTISPECIES: spore protease YyaC [Geobacillus]|uniref:spore protease YyaC n=1 Tax=Geobacillus TaxID=129337 RepID=UPI0005CD46C5|nr:MULTISPECIES: spore protease YyaC [Geobacillus]ASS87413.1 spore protease YyaC [Geobacillus lituanicus]MCK7607786.1 spore protease YyaC [Geobacillus stearothermophilus]PJW14511.1 spore protease YyaC [Geobacillus sp. Manikaran-105]PJW17569.1 spore protease YyaC [Geobacillus sp. WSUCF-018B]WJQ14077.1 spore protease YyaC [Geobacillus stearothermophilus]
MSIPSIFFSSREERNRVFYDEQGAASSIAWRITSLLPDPLVQPIAVVCIGTDRSTGDSLGPLVGTMLKEKPLARFHVYGTLEEPIHAVNLEEKVGAIQLIHRDPFIIAVDACLGRLKSVGAITVSKGPVRPGAGVNKQLPPVGDAHITGVVNVSGFMEFFVLQNTRLHLVMNMAKTIANGIYEAERHIIRKERAAQPLLKDRHSLW